MGFASRYQVVLVLQPTTFEQLVVESWLQGVGVPVQVMAPADQLQPDSEAQLVLVALLLQSPAVPIHTELLYQEQPLAERQLVLLSLPAQVVGVPLQVAVPDDQEQPLAERQVELVVAEMQVVGSPAQVPTPVVDHVQPLAVRQVELARLVLHTVGVPLHRALVEFQVQPV